MRNFKSLSSKAGILIGTQIASIALLVTTFNVNTTCLFVAHQPKLPDATKKLRKF